MGGRSLNSYFLFYLPVIKAKGLFPAVPLPGEAGHLDPAIPTGQPAYTRGSSLKAGWHGVSELVRPGVGAAIIERGVTEAYLGLLMEQVDAPKAALRHFIRTREGHPITSGPKFLQVKITRLASPSS